MSKRVFVLGSAMCSLLALGPACSGGGTPTTATQVVSSGTQVATAGANAGSSGSSSAGTPVVAGSGAGGSGSVAMSGSLGSSGTSTSGTVATSTTGSASGSAGSGTGGTGSSSGAVSSGDSSGATGADAGTMTAPDTDASTTWPASAQIPVDGGANGMTAPGLGADTPSPPKPMVGPTTGNTKRDIQFLPSQADPAATMYEGTQHGRLDTSLPLKWKLIVLLPGLGGGPGLGTSGWIASQGFHEFDVAYDTAEVPPHNGGEDPALVGNTRMNQFDAKGRMPAAAQYTRPNCIEERIIKGLQYLAAKDPLGGWDWYLNADGTMRWSDAGFFGYSYGATHAAIISVYVRLGLVISASGPWFEFHPEGTWLRTPSATPGDRAYAIFGKLDGRWPDYINNTKLLGWPGPYPFEITASTSGPLAGPTPWYMGSHSILVDDQGHTEFCAQSYSECLYAFDGAGH